MPADFFLPSVSFREEAAVAAATGGGRPFLCPYKGCDKCYFYEYKLNLHLKRGHVKEEMVEHNGSNEFSDGSDSEHLVRGPGKGKMRLGGGGGNSRLASTAALKIVSDHPLGQDDLMNDAGGNNEVFEDDEETEDDVD
ncbi:zinc finger transcription factor YY1-like [Selaginella moellendorffii]|uniref:zinc finger transcription factor YY1-like n=1 Tax=Selaginella moellendorffii TaxID=88036 RepID=UPI000D1CE836|nr:zinc finger transcription factor YY1-like [Selaginella moellendorffii]|eukprot:XP_024527318.1 zinc finger transcription factor YY1-like [Selaginella moellendorffii]